MTKRKKPETLGDKFYKSVCDVANEIGQEPAMVSKADYFTSTIKSTLSEWEMRKIGGFKKLMDMHFPPDKNVIIDSASKMVRQHRNKLDAHYGRDIVLKDEFLSVFKEVMAKNPIVLHPKVKPIKKTAQHIKRSLVVHFSDTHFGCNIDAAEMDNVNAFNWTVAARRMALMMDQVVTYKPQYRDETELVMLINGDIIAGVIHNQEWAVDLLTTQFAGAINIFSQAISYAAQHFAKVRVVCTPGNHGRAMHKAAKDRASVHKWDSYENMIYVALREIFKGRPGLEFVIPECPYAIVDVQGNKFLVTHGDTVINVGNPGKNLNMKSINDQINRVNSQLIKGDENFAAIVVGHVHVPTVQETESGTMLLINGTLSGADPFAQSLGIFSKNATQTLFEVVKGHAVGDIRLIRLRNADDQEKLESIIKPFKGKF